MSHLKRKKKMQYKDLFLSFQSVKQIFQFFNTRIKINNSEIKFMKKLIHVEVYIKQCKQIFTMCVSKCIFNLLCILSLIFPQISKPVDKLQENLLRLYQLTEIAGFRLETFE